MSKFCINCGNKLDENDNYCDQCRTPVDNVDKTTEQNKTSDFNNVDSQSELPVISKRELVVAVLLSMLTCGFYGIYWFVKLTDEANAASGKDETSGIVAIIFTFITCGIYSIYWSYNMGEKMHAAGKRYGGEIANNSTLYLLLSFFRLDIVNYCLI